MRDFLSLLVRINGSPKKYTNLNLIEIIILGLILAVSRLRTTKSDQDIRDSQERSPRWK